MKLSAFIFGLLSAGTASPLTVLAYFLAKERFNELPALAFLALPLGAYLATGLTERYAYFAGGLFLILAIAWTAIATLAWQNFDMLPVYVTALHVIAGILALAGARFERNQPA
jgi:hypothetical protein